MALRFCVAWWNILKHSTRFHTSHTTPPAPTTTTTHHRRHPTHQTPNTNQLPRLAMAPSNNSSPSDILAQIGLPQTQNSHHENNTIASQALVHLIQSNKLSIQDAQHAIHHVSNNVVTNTIPTKKQKPKNHHQQQQQKHTKQKEKYRTRHIALQFSYDGTNYSGFAQNIGKEEDNSVEKALFAALEKTRMLLDPSMIDFSVRGDNNHDDTASEKDEKGDVSARTASKYSRCGRTDKGVHANGQVIALYLKSAFPVGTKISLSNKDNMKPGEFLTEEDLPKNSLDAIECYVPRRSKKSKKQSNNNNNSNESIDEHLDSLELKTITEYDYARILNNVLPPSIRITGWCPVSSEFSARFSCSKRTYRYFFPRRNLDLNAMSKALSYMIGRHDFRNLCKMNCEQVYNFERVILEGKVVTPHRVYKVTDESNVSHHSELMNDSDPRDVCYVEIVGQAFLWHQIRCIMAVLFLVGRGLERPSVVKELLDIVTNPAKPSYEMASENALVLQDCTFANLALGRSVKNLWDVTKVLETRWEKHAVEAERARDLIDTVKKAEVRWADLVSFVEQISKERKRKEQKRDGMLVSSDMLEEDIEQSLRKHIPTNYSTAKILPWSMAIDAIAKVLNVHPHLPNGVNASTKGLTESTIHTPLMERARGTTYEEKVQSILSVESNVNGKTTSKRKERYEENIIKKRKTADEDKAFYDHMLKQGGSSV